MFVHKNIGPLKVKGRVVCRFQIGKPVPEIALKHWSDEDKKRLKDAGVISDGPIRNSEEGQQKNSEQRSNSTNDDQKRSRNSES